MDRSRLAALHALDPSDTAASDALKREDRRASIPTHLIEIARKDLASFPLLGGWDLYLARINDGEAGEAWFTAPSLGVAGEWACDWANIAQSWAEELRIEVAVAPIQRDDDNLIPEDGWRDCGWDWDQVDVWLVSVGPSVA